MSIENATNLKLVIGNANQFLNDNIAMSLLCQAINKKFLNSLLSRDTSISI